MLATGNSAIDAIKLFANKFCNVFHILLGELIMKLSIMFNCANISQIAINKIIIPNLRTYNGNFIVTLIFQIFFSIF